MKPRERITAIRKAKGFTERIALAEDDMPGTPFDGFFLDCAEAWTWTQREDPEAKRKARCPMARQWLNDNWKTYCQETKTEAETSARDFYRFAGHCLADACARGESGFLRELADALDAWTKHKAQPDRLRSALVLIHFTQRRLESVPLTMRHILRKLPLHGVAVTPDAPRLVRRLCAELGIKLAGKPGRPKPAK